MFIATDARDAVLAVAHGRRSCSRHRADADARAVLTPFLTFVLSGWLDDEPLSMGLFAGGVIVLVGVYVGALQPLPTP